MKKYDRWVAILTPPFYIIGTIGHAAQQLLPMMIAFTPFTIMATVIIAYLPAILQRNFKLLIWLGITFTMTLILEIVGVATSLIFGSYAYGATLGVKIFAVPLAIGLNWTVVILGIISFLDRNISQKTAVVIATALMAVLFDWIMEPVAIALDYWSWEHTVIPLQNYLAWGVIALIFAGLYKLMKLECKSHVPSIVVAIQSCFFLALRFIVA